MYDFYDLNPRAEPSVQFLPTDAINYNGHWLDKEIAGFRTLTVSGRESFSRQVNAPDRSGDGAIYLSSRLEQRKIEVTFALQAKESTTFNNEMAKLLQILSAPNAKIVFNDDVSFYYKGSVTSFDLDKPLLTTKGKFEIECPDPYKYSDIRKVQGVEAAVTIHDDDILYPQTPKTLEFIPSSSISSFSVSSMGKKLTLYETVAANSRIMVDFENLQIKVNEVSRLMSVDLSSNFSDFTIMNGGIVTFNAVGTYTIKYEVKRL